MHSENSLSILFWINASRAKANAANIYARITVNGKRANISVNCKTLISQWNSSKSRVVGGGKSGKIVNAHLDQVYSNLFQAFQLLKSRELPITAQSIKA